MGKYCSTIDGVDSINFLNGFFELAVKLIGCLVSTA